MKKLTILGIFFILAGIIANFSIKTTAFTIFQDSAFTFNIPFLILFFSGLFMLAVARSVSGGLEQALDDDTVGVVSFVRHGEKDKEGKLTKVGREQARTLGTNLKEIYKERNEGNLYLAASSSPMERVAETVRGIMGAEPKYNKPILKDDRLIPQFIGEIKKKYMQIYESEGATAADDWYINSKYGENVAEQLANFLESNKEKFDKLKHKGRKFHYIAGTHATSPEALLQRIIIKNGKRGFKSIEEMGGTLGFAEPINFMLKTDGSYQVNFRDNVYDVDMNMLNKLAGKK